MDQFPEYEFKALAKMSSNQIKNYYQLQKFLWTWVYIQERKNAKRGSRDGMYFDCG